MNNNQKVTLAQLVRDVNTPKSNLLAIASQVGAVSPAKAKALDKIIARLEAWQARNKPVFKN